MFLIFTVALAGAQPHSDKDKKVPRMLKHTRYLFYLAGQEQAHTVSINPSRPGLDPPA